MNLEEINKLVGSDKRQQLIGALKYCMRSEEFYGRLVIDDKVKGNSFEFLGSRLENMNLLKVECLSDVIAIILITKNMVLLSTKAFLQSTVHGKKLGYITQNSGDSVYVNIQPLRDFYEKKNLRSISMFLQSLENIVALDVKKLQTFQNESRELLGEELPEEFFTKGKVEQEKEEQTIFRIIILRELIRKLEDSTDLLESEDFKSSNTSFLGISKSNKNNREIFINFRKWLENVADKDKINEEVECILIDVCFPNIKDDKLNYLVKKLERISLSIKIFLEENENIGMDYNDIKDASKIVKINFNELLSDFNENTDKITVEKVKELSDLEKKAKDINAELRRRNEFRKGNQSWIYKI